MKKKFFFVSAVLLSVIFFSCDNGENNFNPGKQKQEYSGNATVTIKYYDYNPYSGKDYFVEEKQYTYNVTVFVNPPMKSGNTTENNPFSLQINPYRISATSEEGHIDISSALIFTVSTGYILLQYWNYTLVGNQLTGTLTDIHKAEAAAANLLWAWDDVAGIKMTMPFAIAQGATMTGTMSNNLFSITITGESYNTYLKFTCQISATK